MNAHLVFCRKCKVRMIATTQDTLSPWDGEPRPVAPSRPRRAAAEDDFAGILADVFRCGGCGDLVIRPAAVQPPPSIRSAA